MAADEIECPGCRLPLPSADRRFDDLRLNASAECWALYGEVTGFALQHTELGRYQQLTVDTYFAQHPGAGTSDLSIEFALIGSHLAIDRAASGAEARDLHQRLGNDRIEWPHLEPPDDLGALTVFDVAIAGPPEHAAQVERWASSVWGSWWPRHDVVRGWLVDHG